MYVPLYVEGCYSTYVDRVICVTWCMCRYSTHVARFICVTLCMCRYLYITIYIIICINNYISYIILVTNSVLHIELVVSHELCIPYWHILYNPIVSYIIFNIIMYICLPPTPPYKYIECTIDWWGDSICNTEFVTHHQLHHINVQNAPRTIESTTNSTIQIWYYQPCHLNVTEFTESVLYIESLYNHMMCHELCILYSSKCHGVHGISVT